jgi:hypothetical protein
MIRFPLDPQTPTIMNIGIRTLSKKMYNNKRSRTLNTQSRNPSNKRNNMKKSFVCFWIDSQLANKQAGVRKLVKMTNRRLIPSIPIEK